MIRRKPGRTPNRRDATYRHTVAKMAREVILERMTFFDFLDEIGGDAVAYETGDDDVDALIDCLEHNDYGDVKELLRRLESS